MLRSNMLRRVLSLLAVSVLSYGGEYLPAVGRSYSDKNGRTLDGKLNLRSVALARSVKALSYNRVRILRIVARTVPNAAPDVWAGILFNPNNAHAALAVYQMTVLASLDGSLRETKYRPAAFRSPACVRGKLRYLRSVA